MTSLTRADLAQFSGTTLYYRHVLNPKLVYTEGVRYLAQAGKAYWLLDAIALALPTVLQKQSDWLYVARLTVSETQDRREGKLVMDTGHTHAPLLWQQDFPCTDFPLLGETKLYVAATALADDSERYVLMLPSEY